MNRKIHKQTHSFPKENSMPSLTPSKFSITSLFNFCTFSVNLNLKQVAYPCSLKKCATKIEYIYTFL